ncbi:dihydrolipoyl dehydrogenase [Winogradskyella sp.]|uniref:dihydrolipoyl dehydrogenase n=1 Tax=Winogradskyella sp. TaxID=1883156 RepID=UPI002625E0EF|nr:dihydrolipoyl dehydrogenase [Winogradskyella sp.]
MLSNIKVPDLGESDSAKIEEILVAVGNKVEEGDILAVIETSKVAVEVPSPGSGVVQEISIAIGDAISEGQLIMSIELSEVSQGGEDSSSKFAKDFEKDLKTQVVVLGSGPGGYSAAFRAADLGKKVIIIEQNATLGGVCLNVGCIPSKALLHAAKVVSETKEMAKFGVKFYSFNVDLDELRKWKNKVIAQLTSGLTGLAKKRNVKVINGVGTFESSSKINVVHSSGKKITIEFEQAIIAAGSEPIKFSDFPNDDPRVLTSTEALEINSIPDRLLVVGGGIIGLEMATVYHELGSKVTIVEFADSLIPGADENIVKPLHDRIAKLYEAIFLSSKVVSVESTLTGMYVKFKGPDGLKKDVFDQVLIAVGRKPNGSLIGAEKAGVNVDERGFISTDSQMKTNIKNIFAIGDVVGQPMLAHKAAHEGKVVAEVIAGMNSHFDNSLIPSVAYTDPEIAWVGLTENRARELGIEYKVAMFPWAASGRSLSIERKEGITKTLYDPISKKILGAGIVGTNAGDLISEAALAIKKECTAQEIGELIHPHPTLSETIAQSAEVFEKTIVDMYIN